MRVSLQWLQELVTCDLPPAAELAERLSIAGFEVDAIEDLAAQAAGVVVGFVRDRQPHPNADKLSVCQVEVGADAPLQIVCGASNVRAGIHVPVALVGAVLPAVDLTIKPAELRGVASSGMICSLKELGLTDSSDGIAILDQLLDSVPAVGSPVGPSFGLDDQVLELAITANRPDGLSMLGIAREVAALSGGRVRAPQAPQAAVAAALDVKADDRAAIETGGLFSLTRLEGLTVGTSPIWLQRRLEKAGIRSINTVVDITNLVMLETGQPLHAFDASRLAAKGAGSDSCSAMGLRQAVAGETLITLDGEERSLSNEALVVTWSDQPIALAGVIGGAEESVHADTQTIWLEAAMFAPQAVRRSGRSVGLRTEASSRFEKGLPREMTLIASDRAVQLLQELCSAKVSGRWLHALPAVETAPIKLRRDGLLNLLGPTEEGDDLGDDEITATLSALGCELQAWEDGEGWSVTIPPSRAMDLRREVDLIEEVARLVGYDRFASHLPDPIEPGGLSASQQAERNLRQALTQAGLQETTALSLVEQAPGRLGLSNPLLADYSHLRDNLHQELLQAARRNLQASQPGFWAFEIGHVFRGDEGAQQQVALLAGVISGERRSELWSSSGKRRLPDYHQARGTLQQALVSLKLPIEDRTLSVDPGQGQPLLHPGRAAQLVVEGRPAGWFGQLHPQMAEALDLPEASYAFELDLQALLTAATRQNRWQPLFRPYATVPASERDLAIVVPRSTSTQALLQAIRKAGKPLLEQVELIDRYEGEQVAEGCCSQAFRLRYRDAERTLTDEAVEATHSKVRASLEKQFQAQQR
ncbi:MAG: hypothetical protein RLZZ11_629 [Cyanobacteriota bacterium]